MTLAPGPSFPPIPDLAVLLMRAQLIRNEKGLSVVAAKSNTERRDCGTRRHYDVFLDRCPVCHLIVGPDLQDLWTRLAAFNKAAPTVTCRPLFLESFGGVQYLGMEHVDGSDFETAVASGRLSEAEGEAIVSEVFSALVATSQPSGGLDDELTALFRELRQRAVLSALDAEFLEKIMLPRMRDGLGRESLDRTIWTNGDFIARNLLVGRDGRPRLVDYEFASRTHFPGELGWRWRHFSKLPEKLLQPASLPPINNHWVEIYCILRQLLFERLVTGQSFSEGATEGAYHNPFLRRLDTLLTDAAGGLQGSALLGRHVLPRRCTAQLFWTVDGEFRESDSLKQVFPAGSKVTLRFELQAPSPGRLQLRLDPSVTACVVRIEALRISSGNQQLDTTVCGPGLVEFLASCDGARCHILAEGVELSFTRSDPQLMLAPITVGAPPPRVMVEVGMTVLPIVVGTLQAETNLALPSDELIQARIELAKTREEVAELSTEVPASCTIFGPARARLRAMERVGRRERERLDAVNQALIRERDRMRSELLVVAEDLYRLQEKRDRSWNAKVATYWRTLCDSLLKRPRGAAAEAVIVHRFDRPVDWAKVPAGSAFEGWLYDENLGAPLAVRMHANGKYRQGMARLPRFDVGVHYSKAGSLAGFCLIVPFPAGVTAHVTFEAKWPGGDWRVFARHQISVVRPDYHACIEDRDRMTPERARALLSRIASLPASRLPLSSAVMPVYNATDTLLGDAAVGLQGSSLVGSGVLARRCTAQLFWTTDGEFRESDSLTKEFPAGSKVTLHFELQAPPAGRLQLRLDPSTSECVVRVEALRMFSDDQQLDSVVCGPGLVEFLVGCNGAQCHTLADGVELSFTGSDPQLIFAPMTVGAPPPRVVLEVCMTVLPIASSTLQGGTDLALSPDEQTRAHIELPNAKEEIAELGREVPAAPHRSSAPSRTELHTMQSLERQEREHLAVMNQTLIRERDGVRSELLAVAESFYGLREETDRSWKGKTAGHWRMIRDFVIGRPRGAAAEMAVTHHFDRPVGWTQVPADSAFEGWVYDENLGTPLAVRMGTDGKYWQGTARMPRFDVGTHYPKAGSFGGFRIPMPLPAGMTAFVTFEARWPGGDWRVFAEHQISVVPPEYQAWIEAFDRMTPEKVRALRSRIDSLPASRLPLISVVMPVYNAPEQWLNRAIESVVEQIYSRWELCIADDASTEPHVRRVLDEWGRRDERIRIVYREHTGHISAASNTAIEIACGDFISLLDHDDEIPPDALAQVALVLTAEPQIDIVYSDEDKIDEHGRRYSPYFKPDYTPELITGQNYISHLSTIRTTLLRQAGGFQTGYEGSQDWDLILRCLDRTQPERIRHIPKVLYHWRSVAGSTARSPGEKPYAVEAARRALLDHFQRQRTSVQLVETPGNQWRVVYPLPETPPLVSIVIPTRNGAALLRTCVESILARTAYPDFEIIVADNSSDDPEALALFDELTRDRVATVVRHAREFNFSAINNAAVAMARGEFVCLLNNDIEVISPDWLRELLSHAVRPGVGAVGAMLYYPDDTIQHAGVILGLGGVANHAFLRQPRGTSGYFNRARLAQNVSAVTGACLVISKQIYEQVGGMDQEHLPVAFNDVDFCLRLRAAGYRNVWTPFAELYHHESKTRGKEDTPEKQARFAREVQYMRQRWGAELDSDPAYNPNLSLSIEGWSLAWPPRLPQIPVDVPSESVSLSHASTMQGMSAAR